VQYFAGATSDDGDCPGSSAARLDVRPDIHYVKTWLDGDAVVSFVNGLNLNSRIGRKLNHDF
jgi:hypothetical protein